MGLADLSERLSTSATARATPLAADARDCAFAWAAYGYGAGVPTNGAVVLHNFQRGASAFEVPLQDLERVRRIHAAAHPERGSNHARSCRSAGTSTSTASRKGTRSGCISTAARVSPFGVYAKGFVRSVDAKARKVHLRVREYYG